MENDFIRVIFHISLTTSVIIASLLLLLPLLHKRYLAQWRYYVWLIVAVRLLIPINITLPNTVVSIKVPEIVMPIAAPLVTLQNEEPATAIQPVEKPEATLPIGEEPATLSSLVETDITSVQTVLSHEPEPTAVFSLTKLLFGIWLSGIIILLLAQAFAYIKFLRKLYYCPRYEITQTIQEAYWRAGTETRIARLPEIRVCSVTPSPILMGIFRPVLLLPHDKYIERELLFILRHELVHFKRRDLFYKSVLVAAKVVHWFNPLVWIMTAQADRDVELSCDDLVMAGLSDDDRVFYGDTILNTLPIKSKWRMEPVFTTSFGSTKKNMKHRLKNLFDRSLKKKGFAEFFAVSMLTVFISGIMVITPAIAAGNEISNPLTSNTAFSNNDDGASRVMLGPYALKKDEACTVTIIWNEGGTQTLQFIKETSSGKESAARTEHRITNRVPLTVTAWEDGNYRFVIPSGKSMTGIVCVVDFKGTEDSVKISTGKEYVSFDELELRTYEDTGSPYIHDILSNHTKRDIVAYERGMLAFDKNGQPLKIKWLPSDSEMIPAYYFLFDWGEENILSGMTSDVYGGWSLNGGSPYHPDPAPENVGQIEYILYNFKNITFSDGTVWVNPNFESWRETYEGKKTDVNILKGYYPYAMEIRQADIKTHDADRLAIADPVQGKLPFYVSSIEPNQVVCIGKIRLEPGIAYTGSVSAENGNGIVIALHESPDITRYSPNVLWTQHFGSDDGKNIHQLYFYTDKPTTYYVYVGSNDAKLTNVTGNLYYGEFTKPSLTNGLNEVDNAAVAYGLNEVDNAAIELMQYSGSWDIVELLIPNMSKEGINKLVEIYNQKNQFHNSKKASDYYNVTGASADERALAMMQKNGTWKYVSPLIPFTTIEGFEKIVALYNQKNPGKKITPDFNNSTTNTAGNVVINLSNKNNFNIAESGSFQAKNNQVLDLDIISSVKGGTVDLFLFDPNGKEQRITIGSSNLTKEVKLSEGLWQYNCSGFFKDGGNIKIVGKIK